MAGIAGIARGGKRAQVQAMLDKIAHRGPAGSETVDTGAVTLGVVAGPQPNALQNLREKHIAADEVSNGHFARASAKATGVILERDPLGVAPLYFGHTADGTLCFASEVKALLILTDNIQEFPPGHRWQGGKLERYFKLEARKPVGGSPQHVAAELRKRLIKSVARRSQQDVAGSWLSGGLDSSILAALARPRARELYTFAAGFPGAPDLAYAREVADYIKSDHHEVIVSLQDILRVLPQVIYHLESFDALLVRSSLTNYLVAKEAADYVTTVFSGEAGDELFAGYDYLRSMDPAELPAELIDITGRLHNTALQRVDRSASAHGTVAYVGFTDPDVVDYALQIPAEYKMHDGVEKWILRLAIGDDIPERVLRRTKSKFWQGAGVEDILATFAEEQISDRDFKQERALANGWRLNTKEELLYYRVFREHFGDLQDLSWMGRTKGAPLS